MDTPHLCNRNVSIQLGNPNIGIERHHQLNIAITINDHESIAFLVQITHSPIEFDLDGLSVPASHAEVAIHLCHYHSWFIASRKSLLHCILLRLSLDKNFYSFAFFQVLQIQQATCGTTLDGAQ